MSIREEVSRLEKEHVEWPGMCIHVGDVIRLLKEAEFVETALADALEAMVLEHDGIDNGHGECANAFVARAALRDAGRLPR